MSHTYRYIFPWADVLPGEVHRSPIYPVIWGNLCVAGEGFFYVNEAKAQCVLCHVIKEDKGSLTTDPLSRLSWLVSFFWMKCSNQTDQLNIFLGNWNMTENHRDLLYETAVCLNMSWMTNATIIRKSGTFNSVMPHTVLLGYFILPQPKAELTWTLHGRCCSVCTSALNPCWVFLLHFKQ